MNLEAERDQMLLRMKEVRKYIYICIYICMYVYMYVCIYDEA